MPGSIKSGFSPMPSAGVIGKRTNGLLAVIRTMRKKISIAMSVATTYGTSAVWTRLEVKTKIAEKIESIKAQ